MQPGRLESLAPLDVARALRHLPGLVFFDTAGNLPATASRPLSVIAARPRRVLTGMLSNEADQRHLRQALAAGPPVTGENGIPLGGLCGWVEYEGCFTFGDYHQMLIYDHQAARWWEVGHLSAELATAPALEPEAASLSTFEPRTTRDAFLAGVGRIHEWIAAGDIYQVNLSQEFTAKVAGGSLFGLYESLRGASPAPMAAWLSLAGREILSSSPETFLKISGRRIQTHPIKGTRPRFADPAADRRSARELLASPKETAELVMITDLLRNDLGRVCEFGSVAVVALLELETLAQVHHLVSTVTGTLRDGCDALEALIACFPGGSITGAPKLRAMEIIRELESVPRGVYCGAIGWLGFNGECALNIPIRTLVRSGGQASYHVGAGIVADSDPVNEYEETLHKAAGIRLAIDRWQHHPGPPPPTPIPPEPANGIAGDSPFT
ncbi:MAG: aminodeoxychorismate synthase component I [Akkermansiaceae bacterium]|nr:aminodeoxychorismate synthase component I [Akkermansiaceae bacterium]